MSFPFRFTSFKDQKIVSTFQHYFCFFTRIHTTRYQAVFKEITIEIFNNKSFNKMFLCMVFKNESHVFFFYYFNLNENNKNENEVQKEKKGKLLFIS